MEAWPNAWASACVPDSKNGFAYPRVLEMDGARVMEVLLIQ